MDSHIQTEHGPGGGARHHFGYGGLEDGVNEGEGADQGDLQQKEVRQGGEEGKEVVAEDEGHGGELQQGGVRKP